MVKIDFHQYIIHGFAENIIICMLMDIVNMKHQENNLYTLLRLSVKDCEIKPSEVDS